MRYTGYSFETHKDEFEGLCFDVKHDRTNNKIEVDVIHVTPPRKPGEGWIEERVVFSFPAPCNKGQWVSLYTRGDGAIYCKSVSCPLYKTCPINSREFRFSSNLREI